MQAGLDQHPDYAQIISPDGREVDVDDVLPCLMRDGDLQLSGCATYRLRKRTVDPVALAVRNQEDGDQVEQAVADPAVIGREHLPHGSACGDHVPMHVEVKAVPGRSVDQHLSQWAVGQSTFHIWAAAPRLWSPRIPIRLTDAARNPIRWLSRSIARERERSDRGDVT